MSDVWLAIIALAVLVMAAIQVGAIIAGVRLARRVEHLAGQIERDVRPLLQNLTDVAAEAKRAATLATMQVERVDRLFGDVAVSAERTMRLATQVLGGPARNGMAFLTAARAALAAFRELRETASRRRQAYRTDSDDEESLFIG